MALELSSNSSLSSMDETGMLTAPMTAMAARKSDLRVGILSSRAIPLRGSSVDQTSDFANVLAQPETNDSMGAGRSFICDLFVELSWNVGKSLIVATEPEQSGQDQYRLTPCGAISSRPVRSVETRAHLQSRPTSERSHD